MWLMPLWTVDNRTKWTKLLLDEDEEQNERLPDAAHREAAAAAANYSF